MNANLSILHLVLNASFVVQLVMLLLVVVLRPGAWVVVLVVSLFGWPYPARVFRSQILTIKEAEFVQAARSVGVPETRIFLRHVLPHLLPLVTPS